LHGDSHALSLALVTLIHRVVGETGADALDIEASHAGNHAYIDITWRGAPLTERLLDDWRAAPLAGLIGGAALGDAIERHDGALRSEVAMAKHARLRLVLPAPPARLATDARPARPEFYDFDLVGLPSANSQRGKTPLRELIYVVFDTETTGLRPSEGDEIVSIAGVRIVNGRIITGETFDRLVDPMRPIPAASTLIHGITDKMVDGCPPARVSLLQFKSFVEDAVLIAHNAAFDMKFLEMKQDVSGAIFDNPVLDTLLLSAYLHDHAPDHDLDSVAARFGVEVSGRHDALGDSMVTAAIFLHMIDLLEQRGITTLGEAIEAADSMVELRKLQARF
jgi:DNA polymerase-3 subunit epsilon